MKKTKKTIAVISGVIVGLFARGSLCNVVNAVTIPEQKDDHCIPVSHTDEIILVLMIALIAFITLIGIIIYWKKSKSTTKEKTIISFVIATLVIVIAVGIIILQSKMM